MVVKLRYLGMLVRPEMVRHLGFRSQRQAAEGLPKPSEEAHIIARITSPRRGTGLRLLINRLQQICTWRQRQKGPDGQPHTVQVLLDSTCLPGSDEKKYAEVQMGPE